MIRVCVDIMGGDKGPQTIIDGVGQALDMFGDAYQLILVGPEEKIREGLKRIGKEESDPRIKIVNATQVIEMGEHPAKAVRSKEDATINVCARLVKNGEADAFFSAGNTGACVASSLLTWGRLQGVERPALATLFPSEQKPFLLLDAGATPDCKTEWLMQFGLMGSIFMDKVLHRPQPAIGLLNNGTEPDKGCALTQSAHVLFANAKEQGFLNFAGNVEGHGIFGGKIDVVVCDGFVGNVFLKSSEQLALAVAHMLKKAVKKSIWRMLGAVLMVPAFKELKKQTDYNEYGGAPLLGVNGICIVGHGISDAKAVRNGIKMAGECVRERVNDTIAECIKSFQAMPKE